MIPFVACVPKSYVPTKPSSLRVRLSILLAVFAGLVLPISLVAQVTFEPNWVQRSPATSPSARSGHAMAYDSAHKQVVLFGGIDSSLDRLNDTWVWDGTNWTKKTPANNPPARDLSSMAYDAAHGQVVLFGGQGSNAELSDTWVWDGTNWTQKTTANVPPARQLHAMAYDSKHSQIVLFGGSTIQSVAYSDTWVWDGTNWTQASPADSPSARKGSSMAYDSMREQVMMFGGYDDAPALGDTWVWDGTNWTQLTPATAPPAREYAGVAYDASYEQTILFGGFGNPGLLNDTWLWNGIDGTQQIPPYWTQQNPPNSPSARGLETMVYDASHGQVVLFGGADPSYTNPLGDTWVWGQGDFGSQAIGTTSAAQAFTFFISSGTTVGSIGVLTQGAPSLDFTGGSNCTLGTYSSDGNCTVNVKFKPAVAGLRMGAVVFYSKAGMSGTQLASVPIYGIGTGPQIAYGPGVQTTVGIGLNRPYGVAVDGAGDVFIADERTNLVVKVPAGGGAQTTVGRGLYEPAGAAVDGAGDVFIADAGHERVVEVPAGGGAQTVVSGFAVPIGVAVDGAGNLFVAESFNNLVVEVPAGGGAQTTVASGLIEPMGVAVDGAGDVFIADWGNNRVVKVSAGSGAQTTVGSGLYEPRGVAVDGAGDVFIADWGNNRVVEVQAGGGTQTTVSSGLKGPFGVTVDAAGDVYIADTSNSRVVKVQRSGPPTLAFPTATAEGTTDTTDGTMTAEIFNIGNQALNFAAALSYPADFSEVSGDSNACISLTSLSAGHECDVPVQFSPQKSGALSESVTLTDNNLNKGGAQQSIQVTGTGKASKLTIHWATPSPITYPTPLSATQLDATANVAGTFTYTPVKGTVLSPGSHTLEATFKPTDTKNYSATAVQVTLEVNKATPVIHWDPALIQIGATLGSAQLNASANVPGKFVYTPGAGTKITTPTETLKVVFTPTNTTDYNTVNDTVSLPVSVIKVSPTNLNYGTVKLDSITTKDVTVTNLGPNPVTIYNPVVSIVKNGNSKEFLAANLCPASLTAHKSCTIRVEFVAGAFYQQQSATLSVTDSSPGSPQKVSLAALTKKP